MLKSYFVNSKSVHFVYSYTLDLSGYHAWTKEVVTLDWFKQIRSALDQKLM